MSCCCITDGIDGHDCSLRLEDMPELDVDIIAHIYVSPPLNC